MELDGFYGEERSKTTGIVCLGENWVDTCREVIASTGSLVQHLFPIKDKVYALHQNIFLTTSKFSYKHSQLFFMTAISFNLLFYSLSHNFYISEYCLFHWFWKEALLQVYEFYAFYHDDIYNVTTFGRESLLQTYNIVSLMLNNVSFSSLDNI